MLKTKKILFICKQRPAQYGASYGLLNSCRFICNALHSMGISAKLVEVIDNNCIDKELHNYKPSHVFIEALWVIPEKFDVLIPLYPHVKWHVRLHSNTPFISNEGIAMDWIRKYVDLSKKYSNFYLSVNSLTMVNELEKTFNTNIVYSPNIYQPDKNEVIKDDVSIKENKNEISIASFGAIRPLKNQLIQAMAAIVFANEMDKKLNFHINYTRIETNGENVHKNLVSLFQGTNHQLIEHDWVLHSDFLKLIKSMDMGLQISFSETFNIVAADFVHQNVPIIGSNEIKWLNMMYWANPTDLDNIVFHMRLAWLGKNINLQRLNKWGLEKYNNDAKFVWKNYLTQI